MIPGLSRESPLLGSSVIAFARRRICSDTATTRAGRALEILPGFCSVQERVKLEAAVLKACRCQMDAWQVTDEKIWGNGLAVPVCVGVPDVWPHIIGLMEQFGYSANEEVDESVYGGALNGISSPGETPIRGVTIHRDVGEFGTRFVARWEGRDVAHCECISDLTEGGQLPALAGWAELSEVETNESMRNKGLGSWVVPSRC